MNQRLQSSSNSPRTRLSISAPLLLLFSSLIVGLIASLLYGYISSGSLSELLRQTRQDGAGGFVAEREEVNAAQAAKAGRMSTKPSMENLNVLKKPLALFSRQPLTGFYRDGYCRVGPEDHGNHAVAGMVTKEFLDYSASKGNDLRTIGLTDGCKWCLCTSRWMEALTGFRKGEIGERAVPKVYLHATDQSALDKLSMEDLKKFAAEGEANSAETTPLGPSSRPSAAVKEV